MPTPLSDSERHHAIEPDRREEEREEPRTSRASGDLEHLVALLLLARRERLQCPRHEIRSFGTHHALDRWHHALGRPGGAYDSRTAISCRRAPLPPRRTAR